MMDRLLDKKKRRDEGGFTLIELLVVIVILGILAAVVVFAVGGIQDRGNESACEIDTRTMVTAEEAAFAEASPGAYQSEAALVSSGFLSKLSTLHDIALPGDAAFDATQDRDPNTAGAQPAPFQVVVRNTDCGAIGNYVGETAADI